MTARDARTVVVIGNGMVGHRFCEKLIECDAARRYKIVAFCEEPRAAYDRVGLTSFFAHRDAEKLMLARLDWYREHGVELHIGDRASQIDRAARIVYSDKGEKIKYDSVVMATGSHPFVPPVEGVKKQGVFLYRTIEDLERIIDHGRKATRCAVIGGGLLGLEAAKAAYDLGLETHVIEFAPRLMPRQIDDAGSKILVKQIESLGVRVHLNKATREILGNGRVAGMRFADGGRLDVDMIIVSTGIRPRDELARETGLEIGPRGGVRVNDHLQTSDPDIYAIGEVALHDGMIYGLVAPGYEMAEIVAANLCGGDKRFRGADLSTKLKLMGVGVASFGRHEPEADEATPLVWEDVFGGNYKKLFFSRDGRRLLGGILIGDTADYATLAALAKSGETPPCDPGALLVGQAGAARGAESLSDAAQICSCNNVAKGELRAAIRARSLTTLDEVKKCTRAGAGCGGCLPLVTSVLNDELQAAGKPVSRRLCEHVAHTRRELYEIVKTHRVTNFADLIQSHGSGHGCEVCKPAVASILASLWNEHILDRDHQTLQDSNDRFLANVQRDGSYSVVPRVPGGEITPDKLIALGRVAKKYRLYTKITGGQRIDMFGAQVRQLPDIWKELIAAGFESGHAYGKAVRTVKSCVGSTWCRYGVQDSVAFAIRVEERYRGIRAPHKIKAAVSGCARECAEAQSKDFGLIATENGYNLYVGGNGGAKPRPAELLAADLDEETALRYIDRFLMYYIQTADKLTRISVWIENMDGGIDHLREVVIDDKLGICAELEKQMQYLVDTYKCEWREVVENPERRRAFRQFVHDGPKELVALEPPSKRPSTPRLEWVRVGTRDDFPRDGGAAINYGGAQIAVFHFASRDEWYACQNACPHQNAPLLSRGILGETGGEPKVACPLHKKTFSLAGGACLSGEDYKLRVFPGKVEGDDVYLQLPPAEQLEAREEIEDCKLKI
jgi:nitrite reductase (NADH) large subunit